MDLYFSPLACSMASRIVVYETGAQANFRRVDLAAGRTEDGGDFRAVNPKGLVPALLLDDGEVLTENLAILQYLADRDPQAGLAPAGFERYRLQQWLSFVGSELHKSIFTPLISRAADAAAKARAREQAVERLAYVDAHLTGREWLLARFSVADAYLAVVLNWAPLVKLDLDAYPQLTAYRDRAHARPSIARALSEERELYRQAA